MQGDTRNKEAHKKKTVISYLFLPITHHDGKQLEFLNEDTNILLSAQVFNSEEEALRANERKKISSPIIIELDISEEQALQNIENHNAKDLAEHVTAVDHMPVSLVDKKFRFK